MHSIILTKTKVQNWHIPKKTKKGASKLMLPFNSFKSAFYSTVTDFAKLRGWSTLQPRITAI